MGVGVRRVGWSAGEAGEQDSLSTFPERPASPELLIFSPGPGGHAHLLTHGDTLNNQVIELLPALLITFCNK